MSSFVAVRIQHSYSLIVRKKTTVMQFVVIFLSIEGNKECCLENTDFHHPSGEESKVSIEALNAQENITTVGTHDIVTLAETVLKNSVLCQRHKQADTWGSFLHQSTTL